MDNEPGPKINPDQTIRQQMDLLDETYQSLSLRFNALGDILYKEDSVKLDYMLGVAIGFKELRSTGKDSGLPAKRMTPQQEIPVVEPFIVKNSISLNKQDEKESLGKKFKKK